MTRIAWVLVVLALSLALGVAVIRSVQAPLFLASGVKEIIGEGRRDLPPGVVGREASDALVRSRSRLAWEFSRAT